MKNPFTQLKGGTKLAVSSVAPLLTVLVLFAVAGNFGIGKIQDLRTQISVAENNKSILTQKLSDAGEQSGGLDDFMIGMLDEGTDPTKPENFQNFTITDNAIIIYFQQYQVAPYVYGEQEVILTR